MEKIKLTDQYVHMIHKFICLDEVELFVKKELRETFKLEIYHRIIDKALVTCLEHNGEKCIYCKELDLLVKLMRMNGNIDLSDHSFVGYDNDMFVEFIKLGKGTYLRFPINKEKEKIPAFVKNIVYLFSDKYEEGEECQYNLLGVCIITNNKFVSLYISNVIYREHRLDNLKSSVFSNSSAYLGSKKGLVGFLCEAIWPYIKDNMPILDIMCGSGAASNVFSQMERVYASDALIFCTMLARVQGSGFNVFKAETLLKKLENYYNENLVLLQKECMDAIQEESRIFHMDMCDRTEVLNEYMKFISSFELYSSTESISTSIGEKVSERKKNHFMKPYCLFTYYFSGVYFGLEQCMQIDSIRFSIDMMESEEEKEWLLGILVIAVSSVASNYGGHFAQPKKIDEKNIYEIIEKRKKSVWLEFSKRMLSIAQDSERYSNEIIPVEGPWERALSEVKKKETDVLVYLDPPYKRDDYSRFYHLLETLVRYDYPESELKGRLRSISNGERFKSEFATRSRKVVEERLVYLIVSVLKEYSVCAWSYSSDGTAEISCVIEEILKKVKCEVFFYETDYKHVLQGKHIKRNDPTVREYCVIFVRK